MKQNRLNYSIRNNKTKEASMNNFEMIYGGELVECEHNEGITLSDTEHYDRVEVWDSNGDITVLGFFTEEGLEILKKLWNSLEDNRR
jgi:hypothetical protein